MENPWKTHGKLMENPWKTHPNESHRNQQRIIGPSRRRTNLPPDYDIDGNQLWEEKQNVRHQAHIETRNDPGNKITELQHFHIPTSGLNTC